jgi:hypothetical protein
VLGGGAQDSAHVRVFRPCCHDDIEATAKEHPGHQTVVYDRLRRAVELGGVHEMAGHPQPGLGQLGRRTHADPVGVEGAGEAVVAADDAVAKELGGDGGAGQPHF